MTNRLLKNSSRNLFDHLANIKFFNSGLQNRFSHTRELFNEDVCSHKQNFPRHVCFLRGSGIGSLPRVQNNAFRIHYRNLASVASIPTRNPSLATINSDDISYFKKILGEKGVVQEEERLDDANTDWMRKYKGSSKLMLQPRSTNEVSQILNYCNSRCLAVVPQGGNTGLVGGSVPVHDELTEFCPGRDLSKFELLIKKQMNEIMSTGWTVGPCKMPKVGNVYPNARYYHWNSDGELFKK